MRLTSRLLLRILIMTLLWIDRCSAVKWLALYRLKQKPWTQAQNCSKGYGLVPKQIKLCKQHLDIMSTVVHASLLAFETCQEQFANRRWNCSSINHVPQLTKDLVRGSREQAYVYAIASAALVHTVARACSIGVTTKCSCGSLPRSAPTGPFKWGGCGDDIQYGLYFSETFTDSSLSNKLKPKRSKKANMNRHNNRAGRMVVSQSLSVACKCHGVSGSCNIKTCWKSLPDFHIIGVTLKTRHALAIEVKTKRVKKKRVFVPLRPNLKTLGADQFIYYTKSPDYCSKDPEMGSMGTVGRFCDKNRSGSGGCRTMCCGRGYHTFVRTISERCRCQYVWCCYVKCDACTKRIELSTCK
uniref:Protein Wnt n=1 Tax=Doryteuthis pealeii TaxID=1051067 RepID=A0A8E6P5G1_DORPE|nr:wnt 11 [Doryteuthis pealeii]